MSVIRKRKSPRARLFLADYAVILRGFQVKPMTVLEAMAEFGIGHTAGYRIVMTMHAMRLLRVAEWTAEDFRRYKPRFAAGSEPDCPPPDTRPNGRKCAALPKLPALSMSSAVIAFGTLIRALDEPRTRMELVEITGMDTSTVRDILDALVANSLAHIALWTARDGVGGMQMPNYLIGPGKNAKKPSRLPKSVISRRYYERKAERDKFAGLSEILIGRKAANQPTTKAHA